MNNFSAELTQGDYVPMYEKTDLWKQHSDELFTPADAVKALELVQQKGLIPGDNESLTLASVSSNIPTHEYKIWQTLKETRKGPTKVIAGDLARLQIPDEFKGKQKGGFFYARWDAKHLPLPDGSLDAILDRKGYLWHLCESKQTREALLRSLQEYRKKLKPGGVLVIDNIEGWDRFFEEMPSQDKLGLVIG